MILLILASIFWSLFFAYPWIDWFMGNHGFLETKIRDWVFDYAEAEGMTAWFAPVDINELLGNKR